MCVCVCVTKAVYDLPPQNKTALLSCKSFLVFVLILAVYEQSRVVTATVEFNVMNSSSCRAAELSMSLLFSCLCFPSLPLSTSMVFNHKFLAPF